VTLQDRSESEADSTRARPVTSAALVGGELSDRMRVWDITLSGRRVRSDANRDRKGSNQDASVQHAVCAWMATLQEQQETQR
jgi:hypothetical protein